MKENVFDVLMYLFENYMEEGPEFSPDQETLTAELAEAGFARGEIRKAFSWLEGLASLRDEPATTTPASTALRHFSPQELGRLDATSRGFLLAMEASGVLSPITREIVIDRAMALGGEDFNVEQLKWVTLMVLFNQPGQETAYDLIENMVFDEMQGQLH